MMIEHVDAIVDMRRHLTLEKGATPNKGAEVLDNLIATDNPGGFAPGGRMNWAADLNLNLLSEKKSTDVAIVRVEQLYPFPHKAFAAEMKRFPNATEVVWCQDEPQNQGAWFFVQHYIHENMLEGQKLGYAGRPASASPAVGYSHLHQEQQKALLDQAFGKLKGFVLTK